MFKIDSSTENVLMSLSASQAYIYNPSILKTLCDMNGCTSNVLSEKKVKFISAENCFNLESDTPNAINVSFRLGDSFRP